MDYGSEMGHAKPSNWGSGSLPSEMEGKRVECRDGVFEVREGRRVWVELSEVKRAHLELSNGYVN